MKWWYWRSTILIYISSKRFSSNSTHGQALLPFAAKEDGETQKETTGYGNEIGFHLISRKRCITEIAT